MVSQWIQIKHINSSMDKESTETIKCSECHCDCHCNDPLHTPNDELDSGGPCVCDDCKCNKVDIEAETKYDLDEDSFNGA